jgi:Ca-activated chloride channel family protein
MRTRGWAGLLAATALALVLPLEGAPQKTVTLQRVDVTRLPDIEVYLTVTDAKGNSVLGLTEFEVSVGLDDAPQKIGALTSALSGGEFLAVALLFDRSGSMKKALDQTKAAAEQFIKRLSVDDRMAVVGFDDKVRVEAAFTADRTALQTAIRGLAPGNDTALYDAIRTALDLFKDVATKRQAILVLSDGKDTRSKATADEALADAKTRGVPIFALALGDLVNEAALWRLADETGGTVLKASRPEELLLLYQKIADQLKNQYLLRFTSTFGRDDRWHKLRVEVASAGEAAAVGDRDFISSFGLGVSRDVISGIERREEKRDILVDAALGALGGLILSLLLLVLLRLVRRDLTFRPVLVVGIVVLLLLLGGIVGVLIKELGA